MKKLIVFTACVTVGMAIGWYIGRSQAVHERAEVVEQLVQSLESSDAVEAARAISYISLIESGETQRTVQLLCTPIAHYYYVYGTNIGKSESRLKLTTMIEGLVRTNRIVADAVEVISTRQP